MKWSELISIIISEFDTFAAQNGFVNRKETVWYRIKGNILISIGFEKRTDGYMAAYRVYPLWEYNEVMHISYGANVLFRNGFFSKAGYMISDSFAYKDVIKSIRSIEKAMSRKIIPELLNISDAVSLRDCVVESNLFFIGDFRKRIIAYCDAYIGDYTNALRLFEECISESGNSDNFKEELKIIKMMKESPDEVDKYFESNILKMTERNKLKNTV